MLLGVSMLLQRFASAVDAQDTSPINSPKTCGPNPIGLALGHVTPGPAMHQYLQWIDKHVRPSEECFVIALVLLNRCGAPFGSKEAGFYLAAALVIAIKLRDDRYYSNSVYAEVMGVHRADLNLLERALLLRLDWEVEVSPAEYSTMQASCYEEVRVSQGLFDVFPAVTTVFHIARDSLEDSFGLLLRDTRVVGVVPRTASWAAGVRHNTIIRSVNQIPVATHAQVMEVLKCAGKNVVIEVFLTTLHQLAPTAPQADVMTNPITLQAQHVFAAPQTMSQMFQAVLPMTCATVSCAA